jgi:anti-sigma factor RsiW
MNCVEWEREIASESESAELEEHLAVCASCREFAREIEANRGAIRELAIDLSAYSAVRRGVLAGIQAERRRRAWRTWSAAAAACVAIFTVSMLVARFNTVAPPAPVAFAKAAPKIEWTPTPRRTRPPIRHAHGAEVAHAVPAKQEPLVVKMLTNDPDVIIVWLVDPKGE